MSRELFTSWPEYQLAIDRILALARKQVCIYDEDLAQASVTVMALAGNEYRVSFGSVAPAPIRGFEVEMLLNGKTLTNDLIKQAVGLVPKIISPITDIRSSKEYRMHMVRVMLERGLKAAAERLEGEGPEYREELI